MEWPLAIRHACLLMRMAQFAPHTNENNVAADSDMSHGNGNSAAVES